MNLNWPLFRVFRRGLWICLGIEICLTFLIAFNDIRPQNPESVMDSFAVSCILAMVLSLALRMPSRLNAMPFPVSVRQWAWLPALAFAILWAGGIVAVFIAMLLLGSSIYQWPLVTALMLQRIPLCVLGFLFVYRFLQLRPYLLGFLFVILFAWQVVEDHLEGFWTSTYFAVLPAVLALIVFYCIEIPKQLAGQDRLLVAQGPNQPVSWMRDLHIASRHTVITCIGNMIDGVLLIGAVLCYWFLLRENTGRLFQIQTYVSRPWLCAFPVLGIFLLQSVLKDSYRRAVASGFGPYSAVWISLMPLTIILAPVAQALGLKKGVVAQCDRCHTCKFVWALRCPHCRFPGTGTIMNKQMAKLARGDTAKSIKVVQVIIRLWVPVQMLLMFGFFGTVGNRPFESHTVLLSFQGSRAARQTATAMKDWVQAHPDADTWLASNGQSPKVPEKYRLHVEYDSHAGHLTVKAYGLRWDSAQDLPTILAESLKGLGTFGTSPLDTRDASGPLFGTRTYLDNRIHWVQRD